MQSNMYSRALAGLLATLLLLLLLRVPYLEAATPSEDNDVRCVDFDSSNSASQFCTIMSSCPELPSAVGVEGTVTSDTATIGWTRAADEESIDGYQVLYWNISSSTYQTMNISLTNPQLMPFNMANLTELTGFQGYMAAVRTFCPSGVGKAVRINNSFMTLARAPDVRPMHEGSTDNTDGMVTVRWSAIPEDEWNGVKLSYQVYYTEVSSRSNGSVTRSLLPSTLEVTLSLRPNSVYLFSVRAVSSGGVGPESELLKIDTGSSTPMPTTTPTPGELATYGLYFIVPAALILAALIIILVLCCKLCYSSRKGGITYVTDITKNINDGRVYHSNFSSATRLELLRQSSQHGRPLPAHPRDSTPSASSATAHLLPKDQQTHPQAGMFPYPSEPFTGARKHPGPLPRIDSESGRSQPVQSPGFPQLSQPFSDISSNTASSVFMEPTTNNTLSPPNPYEVPAESDTGHHSASPPSNTLPHPRRPHTATARMMTSPSQPNLPAPPTRVPPPMTQSSVELFHHYPAQTHMLSPRSPVEIIRESPSHNGSSTIMAGSSHTGSNMDGSVFYCAPADSIAGNSTLPGGSSLVSSDQYSDYSDIPHIDPMPTIPDSSPMHSPFNGHNGSSSESISSFSSDSQRSGSIPNTRPWEIAPERSNSTSAFSGHGGLTSPLGKNSTGHAGNHSSYPAPYIAPNNSGPGFTQGHSFHTHSS